MEITEIPFGFIKGDKIFLKGWNDHKEREIGEVRDGDIEKSTQFFTERFSDLVKKVDEVTEKIDSTENKGSFLMKLVHLKEHLPTHDGLGDYAALLDKIEKYESLVRDIIQKNRARNTEIKMALIDEAKSINDIIIWKEATEKAHDLKSRWIKTGSAEEDKSEAIEEEFWGIISSFFERKKQFYEDKQKLTEHRIRQYKELVESAEALKDLHGQERFEKVKLLKEQWKEVGGVPADHYKPLLEEFNKHLKGGRKFESKRTDYTEILQLLTTIKEGKQPFDKRELDQLKKNIFRDKSRSDDKKQALELIQLLNEREFVLKLANKRFPDFAKLEKEKKKSIKIGIIKDLIQRDTDDLKVYEENSANFSSSDGSMNKLVEGKINGQKKKIAVKTKLLGWIDSGEF